MPPFWDPFGEVFCAEKCSFLCLYVLVGVRTPKSAMGGPKRTRNWELWGPKTPNLGPFPDQPGHFLELLGPKCPHLGTQFILRGSIWGIFLAIVFFLHSTHGNAMQKRQRPPPSSAAGPRSRAAVYTCNRLLWREHIFQYLNISIAEYLIIFIPGITISLNIGHASPQ